MEELITIVAALSTAVAGTISAYAGWLSARKAHQLEARSKAGRVFAHFERTPTGQNKWVITNRSDSEIYDVQLVLPDAHLSFDSLSPGERRAFLDVTAIEHPEPSDSTLSFKDATDRHWKISGSGLKETNKDKTQRPEFFSSLTASTTVAILSALIAMGAVVAAATLTWIR